MKNELEQVVLGLYYEDQLNDTMSYYEVINVLVDNLDAERYTIKDLNDCYEYFENNF